MCFIRNFWIQTDNDRIRVQPLREPGTRARDRYNLEINPDPNKVSGSASLFGKSDPFSPGAVIECFKVALKGAGAVDSENELLSFLSVKHSLLLYVLASSSFYFDAFLPA